MTLDFLMIARHVRLIEAASSLLPVDANVRV